MNKKLRHGIRVVVLIFLGMLCCGWGHLARAEENTIKIASIFAKTGAAAGNNFQLIQAVRLARDEINAAGGLLGKKLQLIEYDNHSTPIQSRLAARKAVKDGVRAVIGASWSDHSLAMAPVFQKAGIVMITPASTNPRVTQVGDFIFRACFTDTFQGQVLAKFVRDEFNAETAVTIVSLVSSYSMGLAKTFSARFTQLGGKILAEETYKEENTDFSEILSRVKKLHPDVLFVPGYDECGGIVKKAQDMGIKAILIGADGWGAKQFLANGGQELTRGYYTSHWSKDVDTPQSRHFVEKYQENYELDETAATGHDAVMLLADAIKRAGSLDSKAIRDALFATKNYQGVSGTLRIDKQGDAVKSVRIMEISEGKPRYYKTVEP